ncbi:MAG: hypothetical protein QM695_01095 [Micropruina sp.]
MIELRREGYTMALYVAICLLGALLALPEDEVRPHALQVVWGVTIGLTAAHWFAFRLSTRLVSAGSSRRSDVGLATAQLLGAAAVAGLSSIVILLFPERLEIVAIQLLLGAFVAVVGFVAARAGRASRTRALIYGVALLLVSVGLALLKNWLVAY